MTSVYRILLAAILATGFFLTQADAVAKPPMAKPESQGFSSERLKALDERIEAYIKAGRISGATSLIARRGKVIHFETYGAQNLERGVKTEKDTLYRIYSMTKPVVGVALMQLYEQGKFKLNDPVEKYFPEFKDQQVFVGVNEDGSFVTEPQKRKMTVIDLMRHTAGMTYAIFSETPLDLAMREEFGTLRDGNSQDFINLLAKYPLLFQPGTRWHYSLSVDVQGVLVERLSGLPLDQYLEENIFKPLNMKDTGFWVPTKDLDRFAELYTYSKEGKLVPMPSDGPLSLKQTEADKPNFFSGGGGLVSSTEDYWRFSQMLLNGGELDGKRVISRTSLDLMRGEHTLRYGINGGGLQYIGLGFGLNFGVVVDPLLTGTYASKGEFNWSGAARTVFWVDPVEDLVVVFMTQLLVPGEIADFRPDLRSFVYQALVD